MKFLSVVVSLGAFASSFMLAACTSATGDNAASTESAETLANNDCRVFIEKASATAGAHHIESLHLFVKTQVGFDSNLKSVSFRGTAHYYNAGDQAIDWAAIHFAGASDYWELDIPVTAHNNSGLSVKNATGRFHVTTVAGTDYELAQDGNDFVLDEALFLNLERVMREHGLRGSYNDDYRREIFTVASSDTAIWSKWDFPYLNPNGCN